MDAKDLMKILQIVKEDASIQVETFDKNGKKVLRRHITSIGLSTDLDMVIIEIDE
ncbi:hypothetical protein CACET_c15470 [Clostridium aceticum]|uniref:Uncharacterized protein n=1 Tax=Clostridium aceticum TaxID=84022 RepID=A0A0G3W8M9_9CLOT|nr:hypothetical protein [Clostridium aceticum]AKL94996.1 hypothetical protein CACET_c15470 [Clostridium aceticum]